MSEYGLIVESSLAKKSVLVMSEAMKRGDMDIVSKINEASGTYIYECDRVYSNEDLTYKERLYELELATEKYLRFLDKLAARYSLV